MAFADLRTRIGALGTMLRGRSRRRVALPAITQIGNPFESIGRSEHIRTVWRALAAAGVPASIYDIYGHTPEASVRAEIGHAQVGQIADGIRLFHLNGDEVGPALRQIEDRQAGWLAKGYNIVAPAWELPRYPDVWAKALDRFDEVWAPTAFVEEALRPAVSIPIHRLRNACEPHIEARLERAHFGVPERSFAILSAFDLRSYASRKNPEAAIEAFARLIAARPESPAHLVLKLNYSERDPAAVAALKESIHDFRARLTLIDAILTNNEIKNLVRCCDCFLSLHRSEGFGRGPAEAMFFGKPVVATGWSGNTDYMDERTAFPVRYALRPVREGEYPHFENQLWADPDVAHAAEILIRIVDDPSLGKARGESARRHMRRSFSDVVLGAAYRERLEAIALAGSA